MPSNFVRRAALHVCIGGSGSSGLCLLSGWQASPERCRITGPPVEIQQLLDEFSDVFAAPQSLPAEHAIIIFPSCQEPNQSAFALIGIRQKQSGDRASSARIASFGNNSTLQQSVCFPGHLSQEEGWTVAFVYWLSQIECFDCHTKIPSSDHRWTFGWIVFSKLDFRAGYHQIMLAAAKEYKTAFQTHSDHYEYKVLPFGVAGGPATFQGAMNHTLKPVLGHRALVFFDDILVFSISFTDHVKHLREVLQLLRQDQWQINFSKCSFAQRELSYLGFVVSQQGVSTEPEKIQQVQQWPVPLSVKQLR